MSDETQSTGGDQQPRPVSPSAAAARRARRIGGRPVPGAAQQSGEPAGPPSPPSPPPPPPAGPTEPPSAQPTPPEWLNWLPAAVLSAGAVVMAVLLVVFSHGVWWGPDPARTPGGGQQLREQVLAAATTCVAATNSYKYTELDAYEAKALDCATGQFAVQLKHTIDTLVRVNAPTLKASQACQINRGGVEAITDDGRQWTILLFGQLTVTNTNSEQPRTDPFAAQARMERVHGSWVISALTPVSAPV